MIKDMEIADLNRKTAEDMVIEQLTELFNKANPKDLDMSVLELVLRNAFGMGATWQDAVNDKEQEGVKSYVDGLTDMYDASIDVYADCEDDDFEEFFDKLLEKKAELKNELP